MTPSTSTHSTPVSLAILAMTSSTFWLRFCTIRIRPAPGSTTARPPAFLTCAVIHACGVDFSADFGPVMLRSRRDRRERAVNVSQMSSPL